MDSERSKKRLSILYNVRRLSPIIIRKFPTISAIWIIGSVAKPIFFDMRSDVDIVVKGLANNKYFELYKFLENNMNAIKFDLLMDNDIKGKDRFILNKRITIYEKTPKRRKTNSKK